MISLVVAERPDRWQLNCKGRIHGWVQQSALPVFALNDDSKRQQYTSSPKFLQAVRRSCAMGAGFAWFCLLTTQAEDGRMRPTSSTSQ